MQRVKVHHKRLTMYNAGKLWGLWHERAKKASLSARIWISNKGKVKLHLWLIFQKNKKKIIYWNKSSVIGYRKSTDSSFIVTDCRRPTPWSKHRPTSCLDRTRFLTRIIAWIINSRDLGMIRIVNSLGKRREIVQFQNLCWLEMQSYSKKI